jgi:hypothetical protein
VPFNNTHASGLDPLLGVFTGFFAYYLYESNPRTAFPQDQRLSELVKWKWSKWSRERENRLKAEEAAARKELSAS